MIQEFDFLEYSESKESAFCKYCSLSFAHPSKSAAAAMDLVYRPTNYRDKRAQERIRDHAEMDYHKQAVRTPKQITGVEVAEVPINECLEEKALEVHSKTGISRAARSCISEKR